MDQAVTAADSIERIRKAIEDIERLLSELKTLILGTLPPGLEIWGATEVVSILDHFINDRLYTCTIDKHWVKGFGFASLEDAYTKLKLLESLWQDFIQHFDLRLYENHLLLSFRGK